MADANEQKATLRLQAYAATFIDILGQGCKLRRLRESQWWQLTPETRTLLSETYGRVQRFRDLYRCFLASFSKSSHLEKQFLESKPTDEEIAIWNASRVSDLRITCIADSIIALVPIQVKEGVFPFSSVLALMGACCNTIISSFCEHRALRGGIALGPCVFNPETNEVYGSAVSVAVELEKSADWPRLLVDTEIVRVGRIFAEHKGTGKVERLNSIMAQHCLSLVAEDDDGKPYLDYLGEGVKRLYNIPQHITDKAKVQGYFRKHLLL